MNWKRVLIFAGAVFGGTLVVGFLVGAIAAAYTLSDRLAPAWLSALPWISNFAIAFGLAYWLGRVQPSKPYVHALLGWVLAGLLNLPFSLSEYTFGAWLYPLVVYAIIPVIGVAIGRHRDRQPEASKWQW